MDLLLNDPDVKPRLRVDFDPKLLLEPPQMQRMVLEPSAWGDTLQLMDGYYLAANRSLRRSLAKRLAPNAERISQVTTITLAPDGSCYRILDGQHRLMAVLVLRKLTLTWNVLILRPVPDAIPQLIRDLQQTSKQSLSDVFETYRNYSPWPEAFADSEAKPHFGSSSAKLTWGSVIRGFALAQIMLTAQALRSGSAIQQDKLLRAWLSTPEEQIQEMRRIMEWWEPAAAVARARKINTMGAFAVIAFAYLLWKQNQDSPAQLLQAPMSIARHPELLNAKQFVNTDQLELFRLLLRMANYRRQNLLSLFDLTGR